jgi:ATP synthase protein I
MTTAEMARTPLAPLVRAAVLPGLLVGGISAVVAAITAGASGFWGALLGMGLVTGFFTLGQVALQAVRSVLPALFLLVGLMTYALQVVILLAVFSTFSRNDAWSEAVSTTALGLTTIACTAVWTVGLVVASTRERIVIYDLGSDAR